jgi:hypothetical protein
LPRARTPKKPVPDASCRTPCGIVRTMNSDIEFFDWLTEVESAPDAETFMAALGLRPSDVTDDVLRGQLVLMRYFLVGAHEALENAVARYRDLSA